MMTSVDEPCPDVLTYLEYREYLRDWFKDRKRRSSAMSYRWLSKRTGVDTGWIVRVFQREGHLSDSSIPAFLHICGLDERQSAYFKALHRFCKTPSDVERSHSFQEMMRLRELESRKLQDAELDYFSSWVPSALRALIGLLRDTSDPGELAKLLSPSVPREDVASAVDLLQRLGLLVADGQGGWNITDRLVTTGAEVGSDALRRYHGQILDLAGRSLDRDHPDERDISTLTLTLASADLPEVKERIVHLRRALLQAAKNSVGADRVFALNVSFFPVSQILSPEILGVSSQQVEVEPR